MNGLLSKHIEVTRLGVANTADLSNTQIKDALKQITEFESAADWLAGDLLAELATRNPRLVNTSGDEQLEFDFMRHLPAYEVAKTIPLDHRQISLSFAHHREIASECATLAEMDSWLAKAAEAGWSLTELRKRLRKRNVDSGKAGKVTGKMAWLEPIAQFVSKCCRKPVSEYTEPEKAALINTLQPLVDYCEKLRLKN
ncbi:MAG: hypothetical protein P1V20_25715 [Verrucomicrobiales bacterium]|nr:hypothetical protein [Verrucomicrobiales bacterium]